MALLRAARLLEELERLGNELLVELEDAPMACVGVNHQITVRQAPHEVDRVRRRHHPVALAVRNEHGLVNDREIDRLGLAPAVDGLELGAIGPERNRLVAVLGSLLQACQELLAGSTSVGCPGEEQELLRVLQREQCSESVEVRDAGHILYALASSGARACEDELAYELGLVLGDDLGDHA